MPQADELPLAAARWRKVEELYDAALALPSAERRGFLARACAGDAALQREVASLLAHDNRNAADTLLDHALTLAMQALAEGDTQGGTMDAPTMKLPMLNDRYELLEVLSDSGGMGKVYRASDTHVGGRLVVVKLLQEKWLQHEWVVTKFKQEATALARIDDPGVVGILDAGALHDGQPWLVLQFVEGRELSHHIRSGGMETADVAEIVKQIGRTLTTAHDAGVIHRDLKPANIIVRRNKSGDWQVKVIDFGIAKVLDDSAQEATPATRFQVGTPQYMSPEQDKGELVTPGNDIYSLGVIAYEMLTGTLPFNAKNLQELAALKQSGLKVNPSDLRPSLAKAVDDALIAALAYDAHKRPASARAFGDQLSQALTAPPPPSPTPPPPVPAKRRSIPVAAVALAALGLIAVIAVLLWWNLSDRSLPSTEVAAARLESQPASGATAAPANPRRYDVEAGFPTGALPPGTVYATIGFTVWRTRPATTRDGADAAVASALRNEV